MNSAIIVSAGSGNRFGTDIPKQFTKLNNQEILSYSVTTFLNHPEIHEVIIVCHINWIEHVKKKYPSCQITKGGKSRQDSCLNGLQSISKKTTNVLIHDAARPFISKSIISNCLTALKTYDSCAPIIPSTDSLVYWDKNKASHIDRSKIFSIQTPQCFKIETIKDILHSNITGTDEIGVLLKLSPKSNITFIKGDIKNRKITYPQDLKNFKI